MLSFQTSLHKKKFPKKLRPLQKGPYQIIDKPTDVTNKLTDSSKNEIVQHRNNLLPYYPKEYAFRDLTQLYSSTGLKIVQKNPQFEHNQNIDKNKNQKLTQQKHLAPKHLLYQTQKHLEKNE